MKTLREKIDEDKEIILDRGNQAKALIEASNRRIGRIKIDKENKIDSINSKTQFQIDSILASGKSRIDSINSKTSLLIESIKSSTLTRTARWGREIEKAIARVEALEHEEDRVARIPRGPRPAKEEVLDAIEAMSWLSEEQRQELTSEEWRRAASGVHPNPIFTGGDDPMDREWLRPGYKESLL